MLTEIYIRNYLLVREQRLSFGPGMTVLSGETGAGKSILVGAISLIFGDPPPALEAFTPGQPVYLEASFDISRNSEVQEFLVAQGYALEGELSLAREFGAGGKSSYFLDGRKISGGLLKELKPLMIDFHHQRDQQRLLSNSYQLTLLDLYAQNQDAREAFTGHYYSLRERLRQLEALQRQEADQRALSELHQYQYEELEQARLHAGEDKELQQEFELLSHAQEINETAGVLAFDLYEREDSLHSQVSRAIASLARYAGINDRLGQFSQALGECQSILADTASGLNDLSQDLSADPERLEVVRERLDLINTLLHKHKVQSIEELLELFRERERQINAFADLQNAITQLQQELKADFFILQELGEKLTRSRERAATKLSAELQQSISMLSLPDAGFKIIIDKITPDKILLPEYLDSCNQRGQDTCQFFFSANKGSALKPLAAVASGGELSRILLAIKMVLSERIEEKLIILDEIDAGIGGKTAEYVAQFIFRLAQRHRILCVTHLAQIAAIAHQQIALHKEAGKRKSEIRMLELDPRHRLEELARMLAGDVSEISLQHAAELISKYKT